jgi:hypothetical protein
MNYRKIWESYHGKIPVDLNGVTFDIHHIDGNRKNNDINNLMCVSIYDHYKIHLNQFNETKSHKERAALNFLKSRIKKIENGELVVVRGKGDIQSKLAFGDAQFHIEWSAPTAIVGEGQGRGNSGFFLMGMYEVQVLDSYESKTYTNGQAASIYKQHPPLVNATRPPGEWNYYDIIFKAPRFDKNGMVTSPATITVLHNGVLVQNNVILRGPTEYIGIPNYKAHADALPIKLQDHGNPVRFRNIWVRPL